jgi:NarL family two-component system sensor histidine kinase LiaS
MEPRFRLFRTLRGRLTLSYILVTVLSLLTLEGAALMVLDLSVAHGAAVSPRAMAESLARVTPQIAPFLIDPSNQTNLKALDTWLNGRGLVPVSGTTLLTVVAVSRDATLLVVGPQGQMLEIWSTWSQSEVKTLEPAAVERLPQTQQLITAALGKQTDYARLSANGPNGLALAAASVRIGEKIVGAVVVASDLGRAESAIVTTTFKGLLPSAILLTILATGIGSLFGILTARGLTRRLKALALAAAAWSRGNFSAVAHDPSEDELGTLAHDLNHMAGELQALLADRQQLAVVEERNRLARDLHDSVKQQVFATSMQVAAARNLMRGDPDAADRRLAEAERLVGEAQRELTSLILELRPAALEGRGLALALREYCADWAHQTGIAAEMRAQGERETPLPIEQALFRVAQEALANVARHSGATAADVQLTWTNEALSLAISDNGRGFETEAARGKGVGLGSMRERVEALGGDLRLESQRTGGGARILARVPLSAGDEKRGSHGSHEGHEGEKAERFTTDVTS